MSCTEKYSLKRIIVRVIPENKVAALTTPLLPEDTHMYKLYVKGTQGKKC